MPTLPQTRLPDPLKKSLRGAWRAVALLAAALGWSTAALAQPAAGSVAQRSVPCVERVDAAASSPPARLANLRYDCLRLVGGQPVLVGRAGRPGAPLVLLVHGLGQNAHRDWAPVIGELAQRFQVATVDLPGFGASPAPGQA